MNSRSDRFELGASSAAYEARALRSAYVAAEAVRGWETFGVDAGVEVAKKVAERLTEKTGEGWQRRLEERTRRRRASGGRRKMLGHP